VSGPVPVPRPDWSPLPYEGCVGVEGKVLFRSAALVLALLRFAPGGSIHEHDAPMDIDVVCIEGDGLVSVGEDRFPLRAGESVRWPAGALHRLWTEGTEMTTLMVEHHVRQ
jgi:quercetin dioxygenase-like cupin family protein